MKDGRTHLAYKAEHAVDLETGAVVAVTVAAGDGGRRRCGRSGDDSGDLAAGGRAHRRGCVCDQHEEVGERVQAEGPREAVTDKGYHSNDTLQALAEAEVRTYISEPDRGRRRWRDKLEAQQAVYGNRRRICGERGKELLGVGNCWNGASRTPMKRGDAASVLARAKKCSQARADSRGRTQPVAGDAAVTRERFILAAE